MFINREFNEILSEVLSNNIIVNNLSAAALPGSIARSVVEAISFANSFTFESINDSIFQSFPDTADGTNLDLAARRLNITRNLDESDISFRNRIMNRMSIASMSNETSIRSNIMAIAGVRNAYIKNNLFGMGSFGVYIEQTNNTEFGINQEIMTRVDNILKKITSAGTKYIVLSPNYRRVAIDVSVRLKEDAEINNNSVINNIVSNASSYINELSMGDNLSFNKLLAEVVNGASNESVNVDITNLYVDGTRHLKTNVIALFDDKFLPDTINVSIG